MDLLCVMTSPRQTSYLTETLAGLDREGADVFDAKLVVSDGPLENKDLSWPAAVFDGPSGTRKAFWRVFQLAVERKVDRLVIVEDDVLPCRNALRYIRKFEVPEDLAFVSFFEMKELKDLESVTPGLYSLGLFEMGPEAGMRKQTRLYCGNQCLLLPRRTLDYLVTCDPFDAGLPEDQWLFPDYSSDAVMGWHLSRSPWPRYGTYVPSLVEHIGATSTYWDHRTLDGRQAVVFAGGEFDALNLPPLKRL
jgi:hypothetical protein